MAFQNFFPKADIEKVSREGEMIYESIKGQHEPQHHGKYLAIDPISRDVFLADDGTEAILKAKEKYPERVFFLVRIGYSAVDTLASLYQYV